AHAGFADERGEGIGEAVAKINARGDEERRDHRGENSQKIGAEMRGFVRPERDGHGNRAGTDGERQGQRIKSAAGNVLQVHFSLNGGSAVHLLFALQHGPAIGNDDQAAANLHDRDGNSKEIQDVRTHQNGGNQEDEAVHGHLTGEDPARGGGVFTGQGEEDGAAANGIHDGKQSAEDQQGAFGDFEQGPSSGGESIAETGL